MKRTEMKALGIASIVTASLLMANGIINLVKSAPSRFYTRVK